MRLSNTSFVSLATVWGVCSLLLLSGAALAVPGSIGLYRNLSHSEPGAFFGADPWQPFQGYLFVWPGDEGLTAFEASFTLPPDVALLDVQLQPPFNLDTGDAGELILHSSECLTGPDPVHAATLTFLYLYQNPLTSFWLFELGPADPSSIGGAGPAYFDCLDQPQLLAGTSYMGGGYDFPLGTSPLCPGPPLIAGTLLALTDVEGPLGATVEMPVLLWNRGFLDCPGYAPPVIDIVLEFALDTQIATLVDFVPSAMPAGWSWQFEAGQFGGTRIHLTSNGGSNWEPSDYHSGIGSLVFELGSTAGTTSVDLVDFGTLTPSWGDVALTLIQTGSVTSGVVATESVSIGALKARF